MNTLFEQSKDLPVVPLAFARWADATEAGPRDEPSSNVVEPVYEVRPEIDEQEIAMKIDRARAEARAEAIEECEERFRADLSVERSAIAHALTSFAQERQRYFSDVERDVVKLALSIAERILQREVAMDATLLAGVVRVAMDKLGDSDGAILRVPMNEVELWQRATKTSGIEVRGDAKLVSGDVVLEAAGGVAELGVRAQLEEVERGFFDLLAKRPA